MTDEDTKYFNCIIKNKFTLLNDSDNLNTILINTLDKLLQELYLFYEEPDKKIISRIRDILQMTANIGDNKRSPITKTIFD